MKYITALGYELLTSKAVQNWPSDQSSVKYGTDLNDIFYLSSDTHAFGGKGDDTYQVWGGRISVTELKASGIDTLDSRAWGGATLPDNVENLVLNGGGSFRGLGNKSDNIIFAGQAASILDGLAGNDVLVGGAGANLFRMTAGNGSDAILQFDILRDRVDLSGYGVEDFKQLLSLGSQIGADVRFTLANGECVILRDTHITELTPHHFGLHQFTSGGQSEMLQIHGAGQLYEANGWRILNNVWNAGDLKQGSDYDVWTSFNNNDLTAGTTFNWSFPVTTDPFANILAYPELIYGRSPWDPSTSVSRGPFPFLVSDIGDLSFEFAVEYGGNTDGFNVSFDLWFLEDAKGGPQSISNEVMIWTHKGDLTPFGECVGTFTDGELSAEIYSSIDGEWPYTAIVFNSAISEGEIKVGLMIKELIKLNIIQENEFLSTIQLGSEVTSGSGFLTVRDFNIYLNTQQADLTLNGTTAANTLTGQSGNDTLDGKAGNDLLYGMEGNDTLIGGGGADLLDGGAGIDTASYATAIASVTADLLVRTANRGDATGDTYVSIENLTGSLYADILNGDDLANVISGGSGADTLLGRGGSDTLNGGDANDTMTGGAGDDTLDGGAGTDTAVFSGLRTDYSFTVLPDGPLEVLDLRAGSPDGRDVVSNVETFRFAEGAYTFAQVTAPPPPVVYTDQVLNGTTVANILLGSEGNDTLDGKAGNDQLLGGNGNDTLIGGAGADKLDGGAGSDTASYATALAGVTADLLTPKTNSADAYGDTFLGIENLTGSNYADRLNGDDSANVLKGGGGADILLGRGGNDSLLGGDANDTLTGDAGDDLLDGGAGADTAIYGGLKADYKFTILADGSLEVLDLRASALDGRDTVWNVESFRFSDGLFTYAQVTAVPPPVIYTDQLLNGDALANIMAGSEGNDTLDGKAGNDQLAGGNANDTLIGGAGADKLDGGAGSDTASYATATASVTADLLSPTLNRGDAYGDTFVSIENLTGSNLADALRGNDAANVLSGGLGADVLLGRGGNDVLLGGDGNDTLNGGLGRDELWGGAGNDIFQFQTLADSTLAASDIIQDFVNGVDKIDLRSIDARSNVAYDQAFTYIGGGAFTGVSGQLQFLNGMVSGDVNGDKIADFQIQVANVQTLTVSDFYL